MVLAPHHKVLNEDNETDEEFIKFRIESSSKKGIVHSIKLERKKTHQGEIRFWKSIKLWEKRVGHQARKDFNQKKKKKRERNECKNFHQVAREYWFIKRHKRHEIPWKIIQVEKDEQKWRFIKKKFNQIEEGDEKKKSKIHFIKKVCLVKSRKMKVHWKG